MVALNAYDIEVIRYIGYQNLSIHFIGSYFESFSHTKYEFNSTYYSEEKYDINIYIQTRNWFFDNYQHMIEKYWHEKCNEKYVYIKALFEKQYTKDDKQAHDNYRYFIENSKAMRDLQLTEASRQQEVKRERAKNLKLQKKENQRRIDRGYDYGWHDDDW